MSKSLPVPTEERRHERHFVVVSYDIRDDRRRDRVFNVMKDFGTWVQFSVFECELDHKSLEQLRTQLEKLIKPEEDSIRWYFLCGHCLNKVRVLGHGKLERYRHVIFI